MTIVLDASERLSNLDKRGTDMAGPAVGFDFGSAIAFEACTGSTGRSRFSLTGLFDGALVVVASLCPLGSEVPALVGSRPAETSDMERYGFR